SDRPGHAGRERHLGARADQQDRQQARRRRPRGDDQADLRAHPAAQLRLGTRGRRGAGQRGRTLAGVRGGRQLCVHRPAFGRRTLSTERRRLERGDSMRKTGPILGTALVALLASFSLPTVSAFAKRQMGMPDMITAAKTPAEHEKLAAHYEQEAKAARAKAEEHRKMADAYRKAGGPLIEKLHFDQ